MTATIADLGTRALRRLGVVVVAASERPALSVTVPVADIALHALQWLGVVASDETPLPADQSVAEAKVLAVIDALIAAGISASATIPQALVEEYTMLTAMQLASAFGKAADGAQRPVLEERIRRVAAVARAQALAEQKVMAVHVSLDARGKTRWSVFDIPSYAEEPYVALAANLLAPEFEKQIDQAAEMRAMRELAQVISLSSLNEPVVAQYF